MDSHGLRLVTSAPNPVRRRAKKSPAALDDRSRLIAKLEYATEQATILNSELTDTLQTIVSLTAQIVAMKEGKSDAS